MLNGANRVFARQTQLIRCVWKDGEEFQTNLQKLKARTAAARRTAHRPHLMSAPVIKDVESRTEKSLLMAHKLYLHDQEGDTEYA